MNPSGAQVFFANEDLGDPGEGHREFCLSLLRIRRIDEIGDGNCKSKSHSISGNFHILTVANTIHKKLLINYCDTEIIDKCANQSIHCWFW